jgi:hypothetical protein
MVQYLELTSDLTLQSLNFKEIRLKEGQLLTWTEVDKLVDKIGAIRYISQVKPNTRKVTLKRSEICYKSEFRKRK